MVYDEKKAKSLVSARFHGLWFGLGLLWWLGLTLRRDFLLLLLSYRGSAYPANLSVFLLGYTKLEVLDPIVGKLLDHRLPLHFLLYFGGRLNDCWAV